MLIIVVPSTVSDHKVGLEIYQIVVAAAMSSPAPKKGMLPPTMPVSIKRENDKPGGGLPTGNSIPRKDSIGWGADDFLGMISHTPPAFSPGSLTMPMTKRGRSGSISSRLLSASELEERGLIDRQQKGVVKVSNSHWHALNLASSSSVDPVHCRISLSAVTKRCKRRWRSSMPVTRLRLKPCWTVAR